MTEPNKIIDIKELLEKVKNGDKKLLIISAILMFIPLIALIIIIGGSSDKYETQQRLRSTGSRKSSFNIVSKTDSIRSPAQKISTGKSSSSWFSSTTPEQQTRYELEQAQDTITRSLQNIEAPYDLGEVQKMMYLAEHNYNLSLAHGAIEISNYDYAEECLMKALNEARDNYFLIAYVYGDLCNIYEAKGDSVKLEEAMKKYAEAVGNIPPEYGGGDLMSIMKNTSQSLNWLSDSADKSKVLEIINKQIAESDGEFSLSTSDIDKVSKNTIKFED